MDHPYSRFAEAVQIIRPLLDGEEVTFSGRFWGTTGARIRGIETHRIPLMIAAQGPKSIDLAFRYGDIWNAVDLSGTPNASQVAERVAVADRASSDHGRAVERSVDLMVSPVPMREMDDIPIITGSSSEIIEALASFAEAGFSEVHCYGPAPSEIDGDQWLPIVDGVHAL
jgi:alkanesulfonate monooxygenase SsuD/methylene tetrahydromethanopterin reductase-like flavin-dependent oxidoreductase (luciferase family)